MTSPQWILHMDYGLSLNAQRGLRVAPSEYNTVLCYAVL